MKKLFTFLITCLTASVGFSQVYLTDEFNYTAPLDSLVNNGWVSISGGNTNALRATKPGLTYTGYPSSGIGNSCFVFNTGQDAVKDPSTAPTSGNVYASFLVKADTARVGDYFFALLPTGSTTAYTGRTFIKNSSAGYFRVAISKSSEAAVYSTDSFSYGQTYLFVVKYIFNTGSTTDDSIALYVMNGAIPSSEPSFPTARPVSPTAADALNIGRCAIRQGSAANAPELSIDGLRFGTTWTDVVVGVIPPPGAPLSVNVAGASQTTANLSWNKGGGYVDSTHTTLVFIKKASAVNPGAPNKNPIVYTANSAFPGGTAYQLDSNARCVYNGDGTSFTVTNLDPGTTYHALFFHVRMKDSAYSTGVTASGQTFGVVAPPGPVKSVIVTHTPYSITYDYTKDSTHADSSHTVIAFLKRNLGITQGASKRSPGYYTANSDFTSNLSTRFEYDTNAKCVYKGDLAKFTVTGLAPKTFYTLLIYEVRDADSAYSSGVVVVDTTISYVPGPVSNLKFNNPGMTTVSLGWNKPVPYTDSTMSTLVFVKQGSAVNTAGTLNLAASAYTADANFAGSGTSFQLDSNAKCVYNGDASNLNITGLSLSTNYFAAVYVVRKADSNYYSAASFTNVTTFGAVPSVLNLAVFGASQTTVNINWGKPGAYVNNDMQTLVFVKKDSLINPGTPVKNAGAYTANADLGGNGTLFELDTLAKCVYNGDGNGVTVTGLTIGTRYHAVVYVVRLADSAYSNRVAGDGSTFGPTLPPPPVVSMNAGGASTTSGLMTWVKDSLYMDSTMTIMLFAKKAAPVNAGIPKTGVAGYTANASFGAGTKFELDSLAYCMYKGDGTGLSVNGLEPGTTYHFVAFVFSDKDTLYSSAKTATLTTNMLPPTPPTSVDVAGASINSVKITWTKPAGYDNAKSTTLVFVKAGPPINAGTPNKNASTYTASTVFGAGTKYQMDSMSTCVFKGDTNFVTVTGLQRGVLYHALVLHYRDADSAYSAGATDDGNVMPPPPVYPIGTIAAVNSTTGVPDSNGVKVRVRGVSYGFNQRATGLQFVVRDNTGGITLFRNTGNFGYTTYAEGDSVEAEGTVTTFRGLAEINLDTIMVLGTGKTLKTPTIVSTVTEAGENDLLRIDSVRFLVPPAGTTWPTTSTNIPVVNRTNDTIMLRVLNTSGLAGQNLPATELFSVTGLGVQFSTSSAAPFAFNGYQLFPRTSADITDIQPPPPADTLLAFDLVSPANLAVDTLRGDTAPTVLFNWTPSVSTVSGVTPIYRIAMDTFGGSFQNPKFTSLSGNGGADTFMLFSYAALSNMFALLPGQTYKVQWGVAALSSTGTFKRSASTVNLVIFVRGMFNGLPSADGGDLMMIYPNPATDRIFVQAGTNIRKVTMLDQLGRVVRELSGEGRTTELQTADLNRGVYFLQVESAGGMTTQKIVLK